LMTEWTSFSSLGRFADVTGLLLYMLLIVVLVNALLTSRALFELSSLLTLSKKMLGV
jgi:hypothetical protein